MAQELDAPALVLWADLDGKWIGRKNSKMMVTYDLDFVQGGASVGKVSCSTPAMGGTSVCGSQVSFNNSREADCEVKLACTAPKLPPGEVELRVTGRTGPNVTLVRKMSLNVRED